MPTAHKNSLPNWQAASAEIRRKYTNIARDELEAAAESADAVVDLVARKTGEARSQVERFVNDLLGQGSATVQRAADAARDYAARASDMAGEGYGQMRQSMLDGYETAQEYVQQRPAQSMFAAFGLGALIGAVATLVLCERR